MEGLCNNDLADMCGCQNSDVMGLVVCGESV